MSIGGGIAVLIVGAILVFAVTTGSVGSVDLRVVGVILMLGGAWGLLFPLLVRGRRRPKGMNARSQQDVIDEGRRTRTEPRRFDSWPP
jgi:hypothetical protein